MAALLARVYLFPLFRLRRLRRPALVGVLALVALYAGLGQAGGHPLLILGKVALVSGLGALFGWRLHRALSARSWRVLTWALPVLWLMPVGQVLGGWVPPLRVLWALAVVFAFGLTLFRGQNGRPLGRSDATGFLSRLGLGLLWATLGGFALLLIHS